MPDAQRRCGGRQMQAYHTVLDRNIGKSINLADVVQKIDA